MAIAPAFLFAHGEEEFFYLPSSSLRRGELLVMFEKNMLVMSEKNNTSYTDI